MSAFARPCPCGTGRSYDGCCGRLHRQEAQAETPEELMRSRYAAYAVGDVDHIFRTWHPRTRPDDLAADTGITWERLEIVDASGDEVEFRAHYRTAAGRGVMHERSRFERRAGRWLYVDGDLSEA
ncbi:YchJ family protein [Mumia sp. DW29H23]|uniref:YchJ family protein n=1 Tax=Mumia sp. DW29H23 TaxID=3421241 RepID=UPI003D69946E